MNEILNKFTVLWSSLTITLRDLDWSTVWTLSIKDSGTADAGTNGGILEEPTIRFDTLPLNNWLLRLKFKLILLGFNN